MQAQKIPMREVTNHRTESISKGYSAFQVNENWAATSLSPCNILILSLLQKYPFLGLGENFYRKQKLFRKRYCLTAHAPIQQQHIGHRGELALQQGFPLIVQRQKKHMSLILKKILYMSLLRELFSLIENVSL